MSLGEESRIENICDTAAYKEVELEELIEILQLENELSDRATDIIRKYNNGHTLTDQQEYALCYEYVKIHGKSIYLKSWWEI